ncbi:MAG: hypothetical protein Q8K86_11480 [Candidatus Nanopelagicaceae bacterium]|nr:hypothetical protein [Candidatus Nanopelagicaceae bacterium]
MDPYPRISGRSGRPLNLDNTFYFDGQAQEPYAVRRIEIYLQSVRPENLVVAIPIADPGSTTYPLPLERIAGKPGYLRLIWTPPETLAVPNIYFDKWVFIPDATGSWDDPDLEVEKCSRFWLYPSTVFVDDGLETIRFGFEPLDLKFAKGDKRPLEVGLMPLPLYDYDQNLVAPIIPQLLGTIHVETMNREVLVDTEPMTIGLRQGSYRSNPFVMKYLLDTSCYLTGTYRYWVTITLPNGQKIRSKEFDFTITP